MKKFAICVMLYVAGGIFTNSYVRSHRMDEWNKAGEKELRSMKAEITTQDLNRVRARTDFAAFNSTVAWPIYAAAKTADVILCTKIRVGAPEILKSK